MINISTNELAILCKILNIYSLKFIEFNFFIEEEEVDAGLKALKEKDLLKNSELTTTGEYIARTIKMYSNCDKFTALNDVYFGVYLDRYCVIEKNEANYCVYNFGKEEMISYFILHIANLQNLKNHEYTSEYITNLDILNTLENENGFEINVLFQVDDLDNVFINRLIYVFDEKLFNVNMLTNRRESYGSKNFSKCIKKIFIDVEYDSNL